MKITSAEANKMIRQLKDQYRMLYTQEGNVVSFIAATTENIEDVRPPYDYADMAAKYNVYLKNFLATGDPNGDGTEVEWPVWTSADKQTLILDADAEKASVTVADVFKSNADIIAALDADETVTAEQKDYITKNIMNGRWFSADLDAHTGAADLWASAFAE